MCSSEVCVRFLFLVEDFRLLFSVSTVFSSPGEEEEEEEETALAFALFLDF